MCHLIMNQNNQLNVNSIQSREIGGIKMREYLGQCKICGKEICCENGFFNGVLLPEHDYLCFKCDQNKQQALEKRGDDSSVSQ